MIEDINNYLAKKSSIHILNFGSYNFIKKNSLLRLTVKIVKDHPTLSYVKISFY